MEIAVVGASGSIGAPVVDRLVERGHTVRGLSRRSEQHPVDLRTGEGLPAALEGCEVLIDATNAGPKEDAARAVLVEGGRRLQAAAREAGVRHHVCISIVGIEEVPLPYYRVKVEQEALVVAGQIPYSIVRSTQFHGLVAYMLAAIAKYRALPGGRARIQPVDPREVAAVIAAVAEAEPSGGLTTVAGPRVRTLTELAREFRSATGRRSLIVPVPWKPALGRALRGGALTDPAPDHRGSVSFESWLGRR